ncbi:hypothetical protein N9F54_00340 [Actinomycetota bacterium]|nr:hypothetical protein [Actinomycetota bacterium]
MAPRHIWGLIFRLDLVSTPAGYPGAWLSLSLNTIVAVLADRVAAKRSR